MSGRAVAILILLVSLGMGVGLWYAQTRAYYVDAESRAVVATRHDGTVETLPVEGLDAIDAATSPLRYRACFEVPMSLAAMTETYAGYPGAVPNVGPGWFSCFDAEAIAAGLESGEALPFLGQADAPYGFDLVLAVFADGRGYAWPQINACGEAAFGGDPLPPGCAPAPRTPERTE